MLWFEDRGTTTPSGNCSEARFANSLIFDAGEHLRCDRPGSAPQLRDNSLSQGVPLPLQQTLSSVFVCTLKRSMSLGVPPPPGWPSSASMQGNKRYHMSPRRGGSAIPPLGHERCLVRWLLVETTKTLRSHEQRYVTPAWPHGLEDCAICADDNICRGHDIGVQLRMPLKYSFMRAASGELRATLSIQRKTLNDLGYYLSLARRRSARGKWKNLGVECSTAKCCATV